MYHDVSLFFERSSGEAESVLIVTIGELILVRKMPKLMLSPTDTYALILAKDQPPLKIRPNVSRFVCFLRDLVMMPSAF